MNLPDQNNDNSVFVNNLVNEPGSSQQHHNLLYEAFVTAIGDTDSDNTK